jgi:hypothetical protein
MADHGEPEYATATGNDYPAHEQQYETFVLIAVMGICHVVCIVLGLVIGAVLGHWVVMTGIFIAATIAAIYGLATGVRIPAAIMVLISLVLMAVYAIT